MTSLISLPSSLHLNPSNYSEWKLLIMQVLKENDLWDVLMNSDSGKLSEKTNKSLIKAEGIICRSINSEELRSLTVLEPEINAKRIWNFFLEKYGSISVTKQDDIIEFLNLLSLKKVGVSKYCEDFKKNFSQLKCSNTQMNEREGTRLIIKNIPSYLSYLYVELDEKREIFINSLDEVEKDLKKEKLKEESDEQKNAIINLQNKRNLLEKSFNVNVLLDLLLKEEKRYRRMIDLRSENDDEKDGNDPITKNDLKIMLSSFSHRGRGRGRGRGRYYRGRGRGRDSYITSERNDNFNDIEKLKTIQCYKCGNMGHYANKCFSDTRKRGSRFIRGARISQVSSHLNEPIKNETKVETKAENKQQESSPSISGLIFSANFNKISSITDPIHLTNWIIDSGASVHLSYDRNLFEEFIPLKEQTLTLVDGNKVSAIGKGVIKLEVQDEKNCRTIILNDVFYIPQSKINLISVHQLNKKGFSVLFSSEDYGCKIFNCNNELVLQAKIDQNVGNLRCFKAKNVKEKLIEEKMLMSIDKDDSTVTNEEDMLLWHRRLAHMHFKGIKKMIKENKLKGVKIKENEINKEISCEECIRAKMTKTPINKIANENKNNDSLSLIHSDICGPFNPPTRNGMKYFISFIDDASRWSVVVLMKSKEEVFTAFKNYKMFVEKFLEKKIKCLRSDNGKEYLSKEFSTFLLENGIKRELTAPYSPSQNGVAERFNRTVVEAIRSMLYTANLSSSFWGEALQTAVFLRNRLSSRSINNKSPYEIWNKHLPDVSMFKVFGCICFYLIEQRSKLEEKGKRAIFLGYSEEAKAYRLFDTEKGSFIISKDVKFLENKFIKELDLIDTESHSSPDLKLIEEDEAYARKLQILEDNKLQILSDEESEKEDGNDENYASKENDKKTESMIKRIRPKRNAKKPEKYRFPLLNISNDIQKENYQESFLDFSEPSSFNEAIHRADSHLWKKAMQEEMSSIIKANTYDLTALPPERFPVSCKWIFKIKRDENGKIIRYKARLVARGFDQEKGVDYQEVFAPVVKFGSIRCLIALTVSLNYDLRQLDVNTAFLNGKIDTEIYMEQPPGFVDAGKENLVCRLNKSIYGLKQASRNWYRTIDEELLKIGFKRLISDNCVYVFKEDQNIIYLAIYVDDIIISGNEKRKIDDIITLLNNKFEMNSLGDLKYILGIQVSRNLRDGSISLCQTEYIKRVLEKFNMNDCKPSSVPFLKDLKLVLRENESGAGSKEMVDQKIYQSALGCLMYIMLSTRPDLAYAISVLSQFSKDPSMFHWKAMMQVFRYLNATKEIGLTYNKKEKQVFSYCDADFASNLIDRRSFSGYFVSVSGAAITWSCRKQNTVARSTAEAEYISVSNACAEVIWTQQLLKELGISLSLPTKIFCDNKPAIAISKNPELHQKTKHIDISHHFIREKIENGLIEVIYIPSTENGADLLTKAVNATQQTMCLSKLGLMIREAN